METLKNQLRHFPPRTEVDIIRQAVYVTQGPKVDHLVRQLTEEPDGLITPEILKKLKILCENDMVDNIAFEIDNHQPKCCLV